MLGDVSEVTDVFICLVRYLEPKLKGPSTSNVNTNQKKQNKKKK